MRLGKCVGLVRPVGPVLVGISLGFMLSLLCVSWVQEPCDPDTSPTPVQDSSGAVRRPSFIWTEPDPETEDFQPRIIPYEPVQQTKPKNMVRAQYISTELGIRERLFVGVLTSKSSIDTFGVSVNRTISHHLDRLVFFTGSQGRRVPHGMSVVTHGDEQPIWNMYQTITYILNHFLSDYDYFYLTQDNTYTQAERIRSLVEHLSTNTLLYMGHPEEFVGGEMLGRFCSGKFGYLLSRALLLILQPFLENCWNDIISTGPDEWLGRCIVQFTNTNCVQQYEGLQYYHYELGKISDLSKEESVEFRNALAVHPVSDPKQMYHLHKHFAQIELQKTYKEIEKLQAEIKNVSLLAFDGNRSTTWPIGINPPFEPKTRFEVLRWDYFTEDQIYSCVDGSPKCNLSGIDRQDIADVIEVAVVELNRKYKPVLHLKKQQLLNGYRRFDPTRGMEYTLDLQLEAINQKGRSCSITKRVHLLRPLSRIEISATRVPVMVTRVHIILPVMFQDREQVQQFLVAYATRALMRDENMVLTFLFIYEPFQAQQVNQDDIFAGVKSQIATFERKYPKAKMPWISVQTESLSQIKLMDAISKKHPVDTLFFLATVKTSVKAEFLNRCRMNSISNWQVFFPIHFQKYNPDIAYHNEQVPRIVDLDRTAGLFDRNSFDEACFYNSDYMAARARMASDVLENEELLEDLDLYDVFVKFSSLHVFRAVEPSLLRGYTYQQCNSRLSEEMFHRCTQSRLEGLGPRAKLISLLFQQDLGNST